MRVHGRLWKVARFCQQAYLAVANQVGEHQAIGVEDTLMLLGWTYDGVGGKCGRPCDLKVVDVPCHGKLGGA